MFVCSVLDVPIGKLIPNAQLLKKLPVIPRQTIHMSSRQENPRCRARQSQLNGDNREKINNVDENTVCVFEENAIIFLELKPRKTHQITDIFNSELIKTIASNDRRSDMQDVGSARRPRRRTAWGRL
ncbi:hypothetical protein GWI33_022376 [Rhynchophorus ferrugineus]|uniref:Uncharacterized protein n=1 Tax=Rhynchophorus ferrugineus TaxID=354439 RepID=A0A834IQ88_RHYFE|nr:hypothetical protein GWI33_022376 [Rhynchophorus ferrugineus]